MIYNQSLFFSSNFKEKYNTCDNNKNSCYLNAFTTLLTWLIIVKIF